MRKRFFYEARGDVKRRYFRLDSLTPYPRYTASNRPEKIDEPYRIRICAGGNLLPYDGDVTTHTASMETIKAHWNSVVSTKDAKYCTGDISNMYLMSDLVESEYVKFDIKLIPQRIIDHYNLNDIVDDKGFVYAKINKAWFGLKQSVEVLVVTGVGVGVWAGSVGGTVGVVWSRPRIGYPCLLRC